MPSPPSSARLAPASILRFITHIVSLAILAVLVPFRVATDLCGDMAGEKALLHRAMELVCGTCERVMGVGKIAAADVGSPGGDAEIGGKKSAGVNSANAIRAEENNNRPEHRGPSSYTTSRHAGVVHPRPIKATNSKTRPALELYLSSEVLELQAEGQGKEGGVGQEAEKKRVTSVGGLDFQG
ncbi:hypothetical protein M427DRAFT_42428 [Gonapodya prolifera JEL478]|uniref:Uncharacterized protein n=1 Tax=Gonapodya prolifera (strain JEL478) TaxID=1344416 RepID=A0A139ANJ0_GONPJ|nr:hypothetical protein M427DRAFT_42428 [Gonapodya prolifera JEL478]|eukprot:KXS18321.1 hypothetical protein M427DRAFT_42428 [Gonapodya prolifera JEL478]